MALLHTIKRFPVGLRSLNVGTHVEFKVKLHVIHFILMFIYYMNYSFEINYICKIMELLFNHHAYVNDIAVLNYML